MARPAEQISVDLQQARFQKADILKIQTDNRPSEYEYALLSQHVYKGDAIKEDDIVEGTEWIVYTTRSGPSQYFGALYHRKDQLVLAHRGTNSLGALWVDFQEIYRNTLGAQKTEIFGFVDEAIKLAKKNKWHLSFTGHSLGAFLAELSVYYCHRSHQYPEVSALTFESPGCHESLEELQSNLVQGKIDLDQLDIVTYLSYPNLVNTCNHHVGTVYSLEPDIGKYGDWSGWHLLQVHTIDNIVTLLKAGAYVPRYVLDWPMGLQRDIFFKHAHFEKEKGQYVLLPEVEGDIQVITQRFQLDYKAHYQIHPVFNDKNLLPLIHFAPSFQRWLKEFYKALRLYQQLEGEQPVIDALRKQSEINSTWDEALTYLLTATITAQQNGMLLLQLLVDAEIKGIKLTVGELRQKVSHWLEEYSHAAADLLKFVHTLGRPSASEGDLKTVLIEKGAELTETGVIVKGIATTIYQSFPKGASAEDIQHIKKLSEHQFDVIKRSGLKTKVVGIEGGAIIKGRIEKLIAAQSVVEMTDDRPTPPSEAQQNSAALLSAHGFLSKPEAREKRSASENDFPKQADKRPK